MPSALLVLSVQRCSTLLACTLIATACNAEYVESKQSVENEAIVEADLLGEDTVLQRSPAVVDFSDEPSLTDLCGGSFPHVPFKRFSSENFIYDAPSPVVVEGYYAELRPADAASAKTVYDEVAFTLFRDVEIHVSSRPASPEFAFEDWSVEFAVSEYPFFAERQIKYYRAMGAVFPFEPLSSYPSKSGSGSNFALNFITAVNLLGGASARPASGDRQLNSAWFRMTGLEIFRAGGVFDNIRTVSVHRQDRQEIAVGYRDDFVILKKDGREPILVALSTVDDAVGLMVCKGH